MAEDNRQTIFGGAAAMSLDRLQAILDAYGARSDRWPEPERAAALVLLAGSEEARRLQDEAAGLDAALSGLQPPSPSDTLRQRLAEIVPAVAESREPAGPSWPFRRLWSQPDLRPAAVAAAMLVAFIVGLLMPSPFRDVAGDATRPAVADGATPDIDALPLVDDDGEEADTAETVLAAVPLQ